MNVVCQARVPAESRASRRTPSVLGRVARGACCAIALPALLATGVVQAGPHVHGVASVDIAIDGRSLVVLVDMPLDSLVGFERAPRTAAERRAAADALSRMRDASAWLIPDATALCSLSEVSVLAPVLEAAAPAAPSSPQGTTGAQDEAHADLRAEVRFDCKEAAQLKTLRLGLADTFNRIRRIDVQVAGPQGQSKSVLRGQARTVRLSR